ncbi:MAG: hypothetical protein ACRD6W_06525, partial [Nitrososphaerales archaeon]
EQAYTNPNGVNTLSQASITQWNEWSSLPVGGGTMGVVETVNITAPTAPGAAPTVSTPQNPVAAATGGIDDFLAFPEKVVGWISNRTNIMRVVKVIIGGLMILVGTNMLIKDTTKIDVGGSVADVAKVAAL